MMAGRRLRAESTMPTTTRRVTHVRGAVPPGSGRGAVPGVPGVRTVGDVDVGFVVRVSSLAIRAII
ncbi:hypothetical protein GCM10010389_59630 [Streptomyces echinoruber]|uniref:Uncharacterized protein n=1 Tax=Streptomyces echinoruber TaxID=68898 RepID=A0A918VNM1_9ACTN|nr:hypothetical protein GCM10010389_59630 [Streptomyces echinoruber]